MKPLVDYLIARVETLRATSLPPIGAAMYEYVLATNGLFVRGEREGLRALLPLAACAVRGLAPVEPFVELTYPRVPAAIVRQMLTAAADARNDFGRPVEIVFHLSWDGARWRLETPPQEQGVTHVQPTGPALASSYERALIIVHSHTNMAAFFSPDDDIEDAGFRIAGVLGTIFTRPTLLVRVCLYGHRWEIPAAWIFDLPPEVADGPTPASGE